MELEEGAANTLTIVYGYRWLYGRSACLDASSQTYMLTLLLG